MKQIKVLILASFITLSFIGCGGGGGSSTDGTTTDNTIAVSNETLSIDTIVAYADDNTSSTPTVQDYIDAGITGVDAENLADVNAAVDARIGIEVDTIAELQSVVDTVTASKAPVANAGIDQNVLTSENVTLDGSGSSDPDNDVLTYSWSFTEIPAGSSAVLSDNTVVNPTFLADVEGTYVLSLVVNDGAIDSNVDSVTITATIGNIAPVADAGADQGVLTDNLVTLDGSSSSDANQDQLRYTWSFISVPNGSSTTNASLSGTNEVNPTFIPDVDGTYLVQLIVNDGNVDSEVDTVTIISSTNYAPVITSPNSININENKKFILTLTATDLENDALSFSIIGGDDSSRFTVVSLTGDLQFNFVTDFEKPIDTNNDNVYTVLVSVSDGHSSSASLLSVTINDVSNMAFEKQTISVTNGNNDMIRIADIDKDSDNDIILLSSTNDTLVWLENDGNFVFSEHLIATDTSLYKELYVGDFDLDGDIDIQTLMYKYLNDGQQNFQPVALPTEEQNKVFADIDKDGNLDIIDEPAMIVAALTGASNICGSIVNVGYRSSNGDGTYTTIPYATAIYQSSILVRTVDWDNDNDNDIVSIARRGACQYFRIALNDGNQNFTGQILDWGTPIYRFEIHDMNDDTYPEVVAITLDTLYLYDNNKIRNLIDTGDYRGVVGGDIDQDGREDIITSSSGTSISIYQNISDVN